MMKRLVPICLAFLILGIVLGGPLVAKGEIIQSLLIGVKQDPGGGFTNADLNGRYYFRRLGINSFETSYREAQTCYGYIDFNSAGSWAGGGTCFDSDGTSETIPSSSFNGTYSVKSEGSFTFIFDEAIDTGHISSDRNFVILSGGFDSGHGPTQDIISAVKISDSPLSLSDLNGTWRYRDLELRNFENTNVNATTCSAHMVFNNGNWNASAECLNSDGDTDTAASVLGTYVINGNAFDLYESGYPEGLVSAYLSKDKNTFIFTRASFLENEFFKGIAIKEGAKTYTDADLSGTYFIHGMNISDIQTNDRGAEIIYGTLTSDGAGNWALTGQNFESDGTSASGTISGTYSVKPDGSFTVTVTSSTPNSTLTGNISGDNNTIILSQDENINDGWVTIQGTVTHNGNPLCAMVLANGQYMFSCDPDGEYQLTVPLDPNGEITLFAFVDGLAPFKVTSEPSSLPSNIEMQLASPDSKTPTVIYTAAGNIDNPGWVDITGFVSLEGTPLCAMVLANGQYMFSCDPDGEYQLSVPLDPSGEVTLFTFVDGLQPYKEIISP